MERPFTIRFHLGVRFSNGPFNFVGGITREKEYVTPDSVTYKGLIADVKGFGFRLERMWYETAGECSELVIEIESDEQVKGMVQLASKIGLTHLYVTGVVDSEWEGEYDDEMMEMLRQQWEMKFDVHSDKDEAEWDVSGPDEDLDFASTGASETNGTSSIDDFQLESGNADCFKGTGSTPEKDLKSIQKQVELHGKPIDEESARDVTDSAISSDSLIADRYFEATTDCQASRWSAEVDELERWLNGDVEMDELGVAKEVPDTEI